MSASPRKKPKESTVIMSQKDGQNIKVFVRCRPLNKDEKAARSYSVLDCPGTREVIVKEKPLSSLTKTFNFDRVFGPSSKQLDVYRSVVEPLIGQVLQGYNCTVFAYGQTGTGKTYTMEGGEGRDTPGMTWEKDPTSGIIPRALSQIFDELRVNVDAEFSVRVSFLELYNEEIFDLLSAHDDTTRLRLYEDNTKKSSVIIQGLEEVQVQSKMDVYNILEKGSKKRQTAATLMNAHSSRSHTVFTVTVHIKESSVEGEELLKIGKLNLVDLAGSENIGRSGALDKRAREAGNINQSLLTLGRVITCLVERAPHIPYRESKLTRLLKDSLGGRTKTSIIATVSPSAMNLEETLSTLDYAHRAKDITNKPEVNQKLSKRAVLKEYTEEIERLRKDLMANRERNGVYIANENYAEMLSQIESQSQEITEKIGQIKALKEEMDKHQEMFEETEQALENKKEELESTNVKLSETEHTLSCTKTVLQKTATERDENKHLVDKHMETETKLGQQARKLLAVSDLATKDLSLVHDKLERKKAVESANEAVSQTFEEKFLADTDTILEEIASYSVDHEASCVAMKEQLSGQLEHRADQMTQLASTLTQLIDDQTGKLGLLKQMEVEDRTTEIEWGSDLEEKVKAKTDHGVNSAGQFLESDLQPLLEGIADKLKEQSAAMTDFSSLVKEDVDSLMSKVEKFSVTMVDNMEAVRKAAVEHNTKQEMVVVDMKHKVEAIVTSESWFKDIVQDMMAKYAEHSSNILRDTGSLTASAETITATTAKFTNSVNEAADGTSTAKISFSQEVAEHSSGVVSRSLAAVEKCGQLNEAVEGSRAEVGRKAGKFVEESKSAWMDMASEVMEKVAGRLKYSQERGRKKSEVNEEAKQGLEKGVEGVQAQVKYTGEQDREGVSTLTKKVSTNDTLTSVLVTRVKEGLETFKTGVTNFLAEDLVQDKATGLTPARADRPFPRYLAATSPHGRILDRLRKQTDTLTVAGRLPLDDDDDDDDSVISASTNMTESRPGSFGETIPGKEEKELKLRGMGSTSSSRAGSRHGSRQGSLTDLASVTSDYDDENADPDGFTKPGLGLKKNKNGREIKRPEVFAKPTRTRSVLSSTNSNSSAH